MVTQNDRVLAYLTRHGSITPLEAIDKLGVTRLGARVYDLKKRGHRIDSEMISVANRFGEVCRVKAYSLAGGKKEEMA
ncbi:MAG: helix-turn-helix domain-containing protein [Clostridia bacterium]|nr:helix-turn-helix domain-containing protein [Clostridia bacterium]